MTRCICLLLFCALCAALTGCPPRPGNQNANDNVSPSLTAAQQQAIQTGMTQIEALFEIFSTLNAFADPRLALDTLGPIESFGECPVVSYVTDAARVNALIAVDFGAGCSSLITANRVVSGLTTSRVNLTTRVGTIDFTTLVFDGGTIQGQLDPVTISSDPAGTNLAGTMSVNTAAVGALVGTFDVTLMQRGQMRINSAIFTVENGPPTQITLTGVIADPSLTLNMVPVQGSAQVDIPSATDAATEQALLTFTTETALNGTVQVQAADVPPTDFQVPGLL